MHSLGCCHNPDRRVSFGRYHSPRIEDVDTTVHSHLNAGSRPQSLDIEDSRGSGRLILQHSINCVTCNLTGAARSVPRQGHQRKADPGFNPTTPMKSSKILTLPYPVSAYQCGLFGYYRHIHKESKGSKGGSILKPLLHTRRCVFHLQWRTFGTEQ